MAVLQVFLEGKKIKELELQAGKEWIAGRASSSDIVLEGEKGISRQHFKIVCNNGSWRAQVLSRYGELYHEEKKTQTIPLENGTKFEAPPFQFIFIDSGAENAEKTSVLQSSSSAVDFSDRTFVGNFNVHPYLKVQDHEGRTVQMFRLEGHAWVAGRDTSCSLFIDNQKFSRRHFEIRLEEGSYLVKDLGSSNGTLLNGEMLSTVTWSHLKSGDVLTVVDWHLHFELRDSSYEEKLQEIPQDMLHPLAPAAEVSPESLYQPENYQPPGFEPSPFTATGDDKKKVNWVRMAIYILAVVGVVAYFTSGEKKESAPQAKSGPNPFEKLTTQQQQYVKDTYRLADRLFKEGRYEMARQEVAKIHQLIPIYEESKNLEKLADIAIQTQVEQQKAEVQEREKQEMEEKIQSVVVECRKKVNAKVEMSTLEDCLMPAVHLNPEHPAILGLKVEADRIIASREEQNERRAEYQAQARRQKVLFEKAKTLQSAGKPLEALEALQAVVSSKFPDPEDFKSQAKREIASIQKSLTTQQTELQAEADEAVKKGDLKTAVITLKKALEINPENETLKGRVNSMVNELKKQMQTLYQEGVLEESVGEVESAKTKWKKILETSVPEEDYYKKAKSKLKKYEAF